MSEDTPPLTLAEYAKRYLRPAVLKFAGLPDTPEGNRRLDELLVIAFSQPDPDWLDD